MVINEKVSSRSQLTTNHQRGENAAMSNILTETQYNISGLPAGLKLALLSDLHGRDYHSIITSLKTHQPSFICITSDFIYGSHPVDDTSPLLLQLKVLPFLSACRSIAPTYVSLGNHEQMLDDADLHAIGGTGVTVDGNDPVIGGLTSPYCLEYRKFRDEYYQTSVNNMASPPPRYPKKVLAEGEKDPKHQMKPRALPDTSWLAEFSSTPGYHILLSHHPEFVEEIHKAAPIDLVLSGHAHGGQWRVYHPVKKQWIGVFAPGQGWWPELTEGLHEIGEHDSHTTLVISRRLTNTAKILRICNKPEIVYISNSENNRSSENKTIYT